MENRICCQWDDTIFWLQSSSQITLQPRVLKQNISVVMQNCNYCDSWITNYEITFPIINLMFPFWRDAEDKSAEMYVLALWLSSVSEWSLTVEAVDHQSRQTLILIIYSNSFSDRHRSLHEHGPTSHIPNDAILWFIPWCVESKRLVCRHSLS